jgi:hypothetical protein
MAVAQKKKGRGLFHKSSDKPTPMAFWMRSQIAVACFHFLMTACLASGFGAVMGSDTCPKIGPYKGRMSGAPVKLRQENSCIRIFFKGADQKFQT